MDGNGSAGHGGAARFPLPSEIADAPGAEDWRSMYPYFTRFQPEDDKRFWFYNSMHFPEPMPAFDTITAEIPYSAIGANTARVFVFPTTLGIEHRIVNGRVYITANPVTDPEEIGRRAAIFGERAGYYFENWDTLYQGWKVRIKGLIDEIASVSVPELPEFDDAAVVTGSTGVAQNHYVRENFHRCLDLFSMMWHHHTEFLMLGYGAYVVFFQFCKQAFPEISDQTVARIVAGIDVIMYRPDDELRNLARVAVEAGVDDLFTEGCSPSQVLAALADRGEGGKTWLAALEQAREPWFNVSTGEASTTTTAAGPTTLRSRSRRCPGTWPRSATACSPTGPPRRCGPNGNGSRPSTGTCSAPRRNRPRSTRCSACAGWCSRTWRTTSSTASTGSPRCSSARSASSARCWRASGCSPTPRTCSSCTIPRSTRRCRT